MGKRWKVYFYVWFVWGFIGNLNAQYIHSLDSFQIQDPDSRKAYFPKTYQDNFLSNYVSIDFLIEFGLSSQVEENIDLLPRDSDSRFQNPSPKEDDFDKTHDFCLPLSELISKTSDFETIDRNPSNIYDFNLSQSFPLVRNFDRINQFLGELYSFYEKGDHLSNFTISLTSNSYLNGLSFNTFEALKYGKGITNTSNADQLPATQIPTVSIHSKHQHSPSLHFESPNSNLVFSSYPNFSSVKQQQSGYSFNAFSDTPFEPTTKDLTFIKSNRSLRLTTYIWEMTDFSDYVSNNTNDYFQLTGYSGDDLKIVIKPLFSGGVEAGTDENVSATQGVASNMPVFPDSGIWTPSTRTYNDFMKITGTLPNSITIDASAVKYFMNWHYGYWDFSTTDVSENHYDLVYYSAVPEPSTYFMTGALLCLLGSNRQTRRSLKLIFAKLFYKLTLKVSCSSIRKKVL